MALANASETNFPPDPMAFQRVNRLVFQSVNYPRARQTVRCPEPREGYFVRVV
jgi:hypothetical protein